MRIIDKAALATPRSPTCQNCGCYCRKPTERHHIIARGMAGGSRMDIPQNLIDLGGWSDCDCHCRAQRGKITISALCYQVTKRYNVDGLTVQTFLRRLQRMDKPIVPWNAEDVEKFWEECKREAV